MAYRNKTYIAFDGDNDMHYYNLMKAWKYNENIDFDFYNAHELNQSHNWAQTESIKRNLKERLDNSKLFILLIGEHTKRLTRFVEYEVKTAIRQNLPIICVNLNGSKEQDNLAPTWFDDYPVIYIPFNEKIIKYVMDNWPSSFQNHRKKGEKGSYYYPDSVYDKLGIK